MGLEYLVDYTVIGILLLMSITAVAVAIERINFYKKVNPENYDTIELLELDLTKRLYIIATIGYSPSTTSIFISF